MNDKDYLRGDPFKDVHAWEDNRQMIPFQPTALTATSSQDSPYFMDYKKLQEQKEYERKIKAGQIFPKYLGNNQFAVENNPFADTEAFVESGPEWQQKVVGRSGWNEQLNKGVDATLNFLDGKSNTYNWNPSVYGDPSNAWNEWSYWGEVGTGITKIFSTPENRSRMQSMLDRMDQRDPNFDEATRLRLTDEFLKSNPEVARYLGTAGVDLYDYTAGAVSDLGLRFRIHQAVVDSSQNVKLGEFANTYKGYEQVGEALKNGIADPTLVRDLAITTALTFGLGTIQVGAASLAKSLGQASVIGARAMSVARASSKALQLTSPFTGLAEGVAYAGIRAAAPTVGKSALATTLARTGAIATEASLQSVLAAYGDQRHEYEWRNLIFRGQDDAAFKPDWQQVALQGAIGAGLGTAMMGVMRFAVGGIGDLKFISKGGWEGYKKNVAGSLDTWARTTEGLTVWGDRLSQGRGVLFGDMVDNYMARSVDNRNLSNIMVNGQRLFSRTVFNPTVAAKASFNMDEASKFANTYAETLGLPAEYVQGLSPTSVERVLFDNLTDPEYLSNAGLTYKEASEILKKYKDIQDKVAVLPEADPVMAKLLVEAQGNPKLAAKLQTDNRLLALADIFDIDYVNKQLQRAGVSFDTVNNLWKTASGGSDLNLGNKIDRDAYRELGRFAANGNKWAYNIQERLKYIDPIRSTPLKVGDAEIDADTLRTALRAALDLDGETRKGRSLFLTDGFLDKDPTGVVEITPDGIVKVHRVTPEIGDGGKIVMRSDAFDHPDYKPENIKGIDSVNQTFDAWKNNVMVELKKLEDEAKVKVDEEIEESVPAEVFAELGKAPTKQVLMRHFDLSGPEAAVASMVMETLGLDIKKVVLKIIRARGKTLERMEAGKAVGAIEWRDIKSGVAALISTSRGADFGTLVHEMGHYNRMLFIGDSAEHVEFRHKLGITDDAWKQFTDWLGYDGPWENDVTKMTPEQRKAEEKFANAWAYYIRSIMFGDGKTNDSSLHRLFSAFGDHLGEMGKKMQTQDAMDKTMNFDVFAKAVYDKLFLRSEGRVTEFWESAVNGVFKNMPQADRERLGEAILGTELWNSHKAKIQKDKLDAEAKIAPLTPKVTRVSRSDIAKSLKGKMSGEGLSPSQKSIRAALKDGKSLEDIEKETRELWARLQSEDQSAWEDNPALRPTSDMAIKGHVADLTDAQLLALPEGHRLKPINGVVRLVYNPETKRMDVGFPVLIVTKDKINREIISRKARADALKRLRESRPKTTTETTTETKPTVLPDPNVIPERFDLGNGWTAVRAEKPSEEQLSKLGPDVVENARTAISYKIVHVTDGNVGGNVVFGWDGVNNMYRPEPPTGINLSKQAQGKGLYGRFLQELSKYFDIASTGVDADTGTLPNAAKVWQKLKAKVEILKPNINFAYTAEELGKAYDNKAYIIRNQSRKISGVPEVETRTKTTIVDPVVAAKDITSDPIIEATTIDVPSREEPTNVVEGIPSTEQTIVHDVVDAVESANLGVREPDGTPVLEVTIDEAVEHTMQITQQETVQESLRDMNEVVPSPSNNESVVIAQAVTVRDNAQAQLETLQQNLPVQVSTTAVVVAAARRATNTPVVEIIRNLLGNEPVPPEVIKMIADYSVLDDRFLNILEKTEGAGNLTQQEVDAYMALPPDVIRKLEDSEVIDKIQNADDPASMAVTLQQQTRVSMQQMNAYVVYTIRLQEARKRMTARKLQKQLDDNKVKYARYVELRAIENKTPENLQELESLQAAAGKYRSAAKQLGLIDATKIVRQRVDEDFRDFVYGKIAERSKTEMLVGRAKPNTIKTDEDFVVRLIANVTDDDNKLRKIAEDAGSDFEQMLSNIYRGGNLIEWFKNKMDVKDLSNEETFNLVLAWANNKKAFSHLTASLKKRAETKVKENEAVFKGTKKQVSSGEQTEEGVGIFEKTSGKELTDRSDQIADAMISMFVKHLQGKESKLKKGKGTLSLVDYFMARRQLAEVPGNKAVATAKMIKEATGIEISENTVGNLAEKIEKEADIFFKDIVDDPEIGNFAKELIDERFGIKVRKTKEKPATTKARELLQSPLEVQVGNDLRKAMNKGEVRNAKQALEYIGSSSSQFSSIADFLSKNANQETLRTMTVLLLEGNVKYRSRKDLPVWRQVSFKNFVQQTGGQYIPTLHLVGVNNDQRGLNVTSITLHEIVHGLTSEYILTKLGIDQSKTGQDWLSDVKAAEATATGWVKKLLTAYLEAVDDGVSVAGIKFLNDSSDPAFNYWSGGAGYGLQNLDEFLSETLSSPSFMGWLLMTPDKTVSYPQWTYLDLFNTMKQDPDWMGAVHLKADQNLLDVLTEVVKMGIADMSAVQRPDAAANWRLKKNFQALAVERHAKAAKRVNKNDPMLLQSQKAIADLKASKGRLYQGLRENALFQEELSKVFPTNAIGVDSTGKPIKLFVGSSEFGIKKWDENKIGMWLTSSSHVARRFGNTVNETYVNLTKNNTLVIDTKDYYDHAHIPTKFVPKEIYRQLMDQILSKVKRWSPSRAEELKNSSDAQIYELFTEEIQDGNRISRWAVDTDTIAKAAKAAGYAGVWFKKVKEGNDIGDQWVVFNKSSLIQTEGLWSLPQLQEIQPLIDAVDLRRRKLKELGLNEEMDAEELNMIGRILNGLDPVDVSTTTILDRVGSTFTPSQLRKISSAFDGTDYRSLSDNERRTFILESVIPKIRAAMGDRNSTNGFYSAFSSSDMGKRVNSLIGGAVDYGDTADSNSVFIQFISKIFDPLMDLRDGEIKNKFEMPSVDRINAERSNIMLRTGLTRFTDKVAATVKDFNSRKAINDTAWSYLTRPEELPKDIAHRDLILEAIQVVNEFNRIRVELLQSNKMLSKKLDYRMYGTSHRANRFAEANQAAFVDAMNAMFVKRTRESNQISIVTAAALGWVDLKRNTATDDITAIRIAEGSPLAKLMPEEKLLGKWVDWEGRIRKAFDDKTTLPKDIQDIHDKGLVSIDDYAQSWKDAYASKVGKPYTALRQAAEIAKNRYLGIDFGDSKSSSPRRQSIGEGRNYTEERIFTHDEIVRDPNLSKFFRNDMFGLMNDDINTQILDAMMTRDLTKFFGARMTMTDLMEILATTGEEITGRQGISQAEVESRVRGYERLRNSWNRAIGIIDSDKDSIDKYAKVVLQNSRIPLTLASSLRAAVTSLPELARALLTSNKNKPMLMQFLPNMVKLAKGVGKNRRQARYQIMSGTHWLRGLATDHILLRESMDPENPFGGTVFGENAGGMAKNFVNGWRVAGERNKYETNWLQRLANRVAPVSSAVGAPLAFVNDMSTLLHIWNAQENITTNLASFRKMAAMLEKDSTTDMAKFADMARKCGLAPQEAINLSTTGLLKTKYIDIIAEAAKNQTLYSDGILDTSKLYAWAGENQERLEAITMMGGYINTTSRLTNVEPTLLDIRVGQSLFGLVMRQYMQFFLSMGVQEIGRRRRSTSVDYTKHLVGLLLMEVVAYGTSRALADPTDDNKGGIDEFEKNPLDYTVRTLTGLPLLGTYAWLSQVIRHTVMGASELMDGPGAEQEFRFPDLLGGPASSAPRRLGGIPDTAAAYYQALQEMISD